MTQQINVAEIKRYQDKSVPTLLKIATRHFNKFIRWRDADGGLFICISCGKVKLSGMCNAGHYMSGGHHSPTRFDPDNVHAQCIQCNHYLSGNLLEYRKRLIEKIGLERVEAVEQKAKIRKHKWDRFSLIQIILEYKGKC